MISMNKLIFPTLLVGIVALLIIIVSQEHGDSPKRAHRLPTLESSEIRSADSRPVRVIESTGNPTAEVSPPTELNIQSLGTLTGLANDDLTGGPIQPRLQVLPRKKGQPSFGSKAIREFIPDSLGAFQVDLPPGEYSLIEVIGSGPRKSKTNYPLRAHFSFVQDFEIREAETTNLILFFGSGATLLGEAIQLEHPEKTTFWIHLYRDTDRRLMGWTLALADSRSQPTERMDAEGHVQDAKHGEFSFGNLSPGSYTIEVSLVRHGMPPVAPWTRSVLVPPEGIDLGQLFISVRAMVGLPPADQNEAGDSSGEYYRLRGGKLFKGKRPQAKN